MPTHGYERGLDFAASQLSEIGSGYQFVWENGALTNSNLG